MSSDSPHTEGNKLFKKSRISESDVEKIKELELAATYSNINEVETVDLLRRGYAPASGCAPNSSLPILGKNIMEEHRLSFLHRTASPVHSNVVRPSSKDHGSMERSRSPTKESLRSSSSQERISERQIAQDSIPSHSINMPGSPKGANYRSHVLRSSQGKESSSPRLSSVPPTLPLPPPLARKTLISVPCRSKSGIPSSPLRGSSSCKQKDFSYSSLRASSDSVQGHSPTEVAVVAVAGSKPAVVSAARPDILSPRAFHGDDSISDHDTGGSRRIISRKGSMADVCSPSLRPVSRSGENLWNTSSRKESNDFEFSTKGGSQSFRPYVPFTRVGEDVTDLLTSRGKTPTLQHEPSEVPGVQSPKIGSAAPNSALTNSALTNSFTATVPPGYLPKEEVLDGTRRFSSTVFPNPLRRPSLPAVLKPRSSMSVTGDSILFSRRQSAQSVLLTQQNSLKHSVHEVKVIETKNLKEWKYRVKRNEWFQIPVLFDLFTYLIQFHELQETIIQDESEIHLVEEALSCLVSRISFSIFEVDGILLFRPFTIWENPNHRKLVKNLCVAWKQGFDSAAFQHASVDLLGAISNNDVSDVTFTRLYKFWRWLGSAKNWKFMMGISAVFGAFAIGLTLVVGLIGATLGFAIQVTLSIIAAVFTLLLVGWNFLFISHNSFADAASTFFREDARSATQLEAYFGVADEGGNENRSGEAMGDSVPLGQQSHSMLGSSPVPLVQAGSARLTNLITNQTVSQCSFVSGVSSADERTNPCGLDLGDHQAFLNSSTVNPERQHSLEHNPLLLEAEESSLQAINNSSLNNGSWRIPGASSSGGRSKPVVTIGVDEDDNHDSREKVQRETTPPQEEKRLKRSESKKYLFNRNSFGSDGNNSNMLTRVVALVLTPSNLTPDDARHTNTNEAIPIMQTDYEQLISSLQGRGFVVLQFSTIGLLDEAFHQGANKANIILLPREIWSSDSKMRIAIGRWMNVEHRSVYYFGMKNRSSANGGNSVQVSPSGSFDEVPLTTTRSRGGGLIDIDSDQICVDDPNPPPSACVGLPLSQKTAAKLHQRAVDRGQTKRKVIFHSYVPPYSLGRRLGGGAFGSVFEAVLDETETRCAVKRIQLGGDDGEENTENQHLLLAGVEEAELLSGVYHPNIVRYMYTERAGNTLSIFMERCGGGTLNTMLSNGTTLVARKVKQILTEVISAVAFLNIKLIIHRDLKPDNILFHEDGSVRLIDFGSARMRKDNFAKMEGTLAYMAPEVLLEMPYGRECDVWSIGCVAADILSVDLPQRGMCFVELHDFFENLKDAPDFVCDEPDVRRFLTRCLQREPSKRAECIDLLQDKILGESSVAIENWLVEAERRKKAIKTSPSFRMAASHPSDSNMSLLTQT